MNDNDEIMTGKEMIDSLQVVGTLFFMFQQCIVCATRQHSIIMDYILILLNGSKIKSNSISKRN